MSHNEINESLSRDFVRMVHEFSRIQVAVPVIFIFIWQKRKVLNFNKSFVRGLLQMQVLFPKPI